MPCAHLNGYHRLLLPSVIHRQMNGPKDRLRSSKAAMERNCFLDSASQTCSAEHILVPPHTAQAPADRRVCLHRGPWRMQLNSQPVPRENISSRTHGRYWAQQGSYLGQTLGPLDFLVMDPSGRAWWKPLSFGPHGD